MRRERDYYPPPPNQHKRPLEGGAPPWGGKGYRTFDGAHSFSGKGYGGGGGKGNYGGKGGGGGGPSGGGKGGSGRSTWGRGAPPEPAAPSNRGGDPQIHVQQLHQLEALVPDGALVLDPLSDRADDVSAALRNLLLCTDTGGRDSAGGGMRTLCIDAGTSDGNESHARHASGLWVHASLMPFAQCASTVPLVSLTIRGMPFVTPAALGPLGDLTQLRALRIEGSPSLPTEALRELQLLSRLELLSLSGCAAVTDQCVGFAMAMPDLHALHLDGTGCADVAVLMGTVLPKLVRLVISETAVTDHGLRLISKRASLVELHAASCPNLTDEGVLLLAAQQTLRVLDLSYCERVTPAAVMRLRQALPSSCALGDRASKPVPAPPPDRVVRPAQTNAGYAFS